MYKAAVIIPNLNGMEYLENCLNSLELQSEKSFRTILIDNGSTDDSVNFVRSYYPKVQVRAYHMNTGFCRACNAGISISDEPYVILLNNDTVCDPDFIKELIQAMDADPGLFSCSARMRSMDDPDIIDDAGDFYCALGWAFARGKGKRADRYDRPKDIFASCGGAVIYRRSMLEETGLLDEAHFAYLEDIDLGYRARILGYKNRYIPSANVLHKGSASSGSRYNAFKVRLSARNSIYLIYKNMPPIQIVCNAPFLAAGFIGKTIFFRRKKLARAYLQGMWAGFRGVRSLQRVPVQKKNWMHYAVIQWELWVNMFRLWRR